MGIYWKQRIKDGWKAEENERKGRCMVLIACDEKTDKELFHYAPNLVDEPFFKKSFEDLKVYDELNKAVAKFEETINTTQTTKNWNDTCRIKQEKQ